METTIKLFLTFFMLSLAFVSLYSKAATCPPVSSIERISGEYAWTTTEPGWNGYFLSPTTGKGRSYVVKRFLAASWVKSHDTINSPGFIQCDYYGDASFQSSDDSNQSQTEIIRFTQKNANGAYMPYGPMAWTCKAVQTYPNEACSCFSNLEKCTFKIG